VMLVWARRHVIFRPVTKKHKRKKWNNLLFIKIYVKKFETAFLDENELKY